MYHKKNYFLGLHTGRNYKLSLSLLPFFFHATINIENMFCTERVIYLAYAEHE